MVLAQDLRNAVLQAAFSGNLTKQLNSDTDVQITLDIIKSEKKALIKKKNARDDVNFPEINEDEKAFLIPENWSWARIGDVGIYKKGPFGSALTKSMFIPKSDGSIKVYEQKNAIQKDFLLGDYYISKDYYKDKMKSFTVESGDIIVSCAGTIGETYVMPDNIELGIINQALMRMNIVDSINIDYFLKYFDHILKEDARKKSKGSAIKNIPPFDIFKKMLIPLPPIEEQQRIVDRVNELMEKIDEYEKVEKELLALEQKFPEDMKNALLQAAMQGKLTEQLENDSSVDEMLDTIKEEKKQLIKEKKIKKEKVLLPIDKNEIPFEIPDNWRWTRLRRICTKIVDGDHNPPHGTLEKTEYLMLSAQNINFNKLVDLNQVRYLTKEVFEQENLRTQVQIGDIFFTIVGTLGRSCIYKGGYNISFQRSVAIISTKIFNCYLKYVLDSPFVQQYMISKATGTAQKGFYLNQVENLLIPVPPIEEQQRIVERLEQLLPLCETL